MYLSVGMHEQGKKRAMARLFSPIERCQEAPVSGPKPSVRGPKQRRCAARRRRNLSGGSGGLQAPHRTRLCSKILDFCQCSDISNKKTDNGSIRR